MKIKTERIKKFRQLPYQQYTGKVGKHKFKAILYEDNFGYFVAENGKRIITFREDAQLEDWIDDAMEKSDYYHNLVNFLEEVRSLHNNKD